MKQHSFGGPWTMIKLNLLERYLAFFNTALQSRPSQERPFKRIYIDAFAGTGECDIKLGDGMRSTIAGSARIALQAIPAFDHLHLIDLNTKHVAELRALVADPSDVNRVTIYQQDANAALNDIIDKTNWRSTRGVLFLDPYGMSAQWDTLKKVAATEALDVWYLFPLSAVYRQAAVEFNKVDDGKAAALDSVLGTTDWRTVFYSESQQVSLLEGERVSARRTSGPAEITTYVHSRLREIFKGWVSEPIMLPEGGGPPMFALFFAVANPTEKAVKLSKKGAEHLFEMLKNRKIGKVAESASDVPAQADFF